MLHVVWSTEALFFNTIFQCRCCCGPTISMHLGPCPHSVHAVHLTVTLPTVLATISPLIHYPNYSSFISLHIWQIKFIHLAFLQECLSYFWPSEISSVTQTHPTFWDCMNCLGPYHPKRAWSCLILEAKQGRAWLVLGWETAWTAARQASLSITNSWSLLKLMFIESVMPSNHLILRRPLLLLPSVFPSIRVFSNESVLRVRWPKYWSFSFSINPSNDYSELLSFRFDWFDLLSVQGTVKSLLQHHSSKVSILWRFDLLNFHINSKIYLSRFTKRLFGD